MREPEPAGAPADLAVLVQGVQPIPVAVHGEVGQVPGNRTQEATSAPTPAPRGPGRVLSSVIARARAADVPVGVHAYSGEEAAEFAAEGATIITATVDATCLGEAVAHHLQVARGSSADQP